MLSSVWARRALVALASLCVAPAAHAQWPDRPIRVLVPFAPGGVTDGIGRLSSEWLSQKLGQSVVVENRTGASGAIAAEATMRAAPDGYTLFTASASQLVMLPALTRVNFDSLRDFAPISIVAGNPQVLGVSERLGVSTLREFVARARAENGQLDFSSAGAGSSNHLAMALLLSAAGIELQHIPYRGGAPAMQALLTGEVAAYFGNPSDFIPHLGAGRMRVIAIAGPNRLPSLPGVQTVAEQGYPGFRAETWNGLVAPAGTPAPIIERLASLLGEACQDAAFRAALERLGTTPECSTPAAFRQAIERDAPLWREAVRISGATLD